MLASVAAGALLFGGAAAVASPWWAEEFGGGTDQPVAQTAAEPVAVVTPDDGAREINPAAPPKITVSDGKIDAVSLVPDAGGSAVAGTVSEDETVWTAAEALAFNTDYTLEYTLAAADGRTTSHTRTFSTVSEAHEADAYVYPVDGSVVGIGQPIEINFSEPVLNKKAVEAAITVTSTSGQKGAFYWVTDTKVRYRPEAFWAPQSTITVDLRLFGVDFGGGMIGNFNKTISVSTHNTRLAVVDNADKMMRVYIDGQLTRTFPVTLGNEDWPSTEGYHVIMDQHESIPFRAESLGLKPGDEHYYEPVTATNASRISNGGAFIHEALPSAQPILGLANVSHGCIGMSPEGAKYIYDMFDAGDVVQVLNTGYGPMDVGDGFGDWNVSWAEWTSQVKQ